ncbi:MAG: hypothetical protein P8N02_06690 [Actinomycetota bacterium]|jgi:hypothetical protein|nr:hypothetical protein [Actinomycetota bacterium]
MAASGRQRDDAGAALATIAMMLFIISIAITLMLRQAEAVQHDAAFRAEDDELLAVTEAVLDRYSAKLGVTASYPAYWVDELERPRTCASSDSVAYSEVTQPGTRWPPDCVAWTYEGGEQWAQHPLFPGVDVAVEVDPPSGAGQRVTVVGRSSQGHVRTVSVMLRAVSLSEFVLVVGTNLRFGSGAQMTGRIYTGGNLQWGTNNSTDENYYAEGWISGTVTELNGAEGYDSSGRASYGDVREVFENPLDFSRFWEDMQQIADLACAGGGICMNDEPTAAAYLVHPYTSGGQQLFDIYWSTAHSGSANSCSYSADEWWEREMHNPAVNWQVWGLALPAPSNGLLWSDRHVVVGNRDGSLGRSGTVWIDESMTLYAGSPGQPKRVVVNSDIEYVDPTGLDVWGLIASDEIVINPDAHNGDEDLTLHASLLGQGNPGLRTAFRCGKHGSYIKHGEFTMLGSLANGYTAWMSQGWSPRNYGYDPRLASVQPPYYPLLSKEWVIVDWSEDFTPAWAQ